MKSYGSLVLAILISMILISYLVAWRFSQNPYYAQFNQTTTLQSISSYQTNCGYSEHDSYFTWQEFPYSLCTEMFYNGNYVQSGIEDLCAPNYGYGDEDKASVVIRNVYDTTFYDRCEIVGRYDAGELSDKPEVLLRCYIKNANYWFTNCCQCDQWGTCYWTCSQKPSNTIAEGYVAFPLCQYSSQSSCPSSYTYDTVSCVNKVKTTKTYRVTYTWTDHCYCNQQTQLISQQSQNVDCCNNNDCPTNYACQNYVCVQQAVCGNKICESGENVNNCPQDCAGTCGDGICNPYYESRNNCPQDCGQVQPVCGNNVCESGENVNNCPKDCAGTCGDGVCNPYYENQNNCPQDCGQVQPNCGNKICESGENVNNCPQDCSGVCGDGVCNKYYENSTNCPQDCPPETPYTSILIIVGIIAIPVIALALLLRKRA